MKPVTYLASTRPTAGPHRAAAPASDAPRARRGGATVMEMLIALAISLTVLAAVGVAVDASFRANAINQEQSNLTQRSRLTMNRIITEIRTTNAHQPIGSTPLAAFKAGQVVSDTGIMMLTEAGKVVEYKYDAPNKRLMVKDPNGKIYVAANGVEDFSVKFEPMRSVLSQQTGGVYDQLLRATVLVTLRTTEPADGTKKALDESVTLSSSVMPRRNTW